MFRIIKISWGWDSNIRNQRFQLTNTTKKKLGVGFEPTGNRSAGGHISHSVTPARGLKIKRGAL